MNRYLELLDEMKEYEEKEKERLKLYFDKGDYVMYSFNQNGINKTEIGRIYHIFFSKEAGTAYYSVAFKRGNISIYDHTLLTPVTNPFDEQKVNDLLEKLSDTDSIKESKSLKEELYNEYTKCIHEFKWRIAGQICSHCNSIKNDEGEIIYPYNND